MEEIKVIEKRVKELLSSEGYNLYSLRFFKKGKENILEIIIDRETEISMNNIVEISEKISNLLDELDLISDAYALDISSLGAEKPLKVENLSKYIDRYIYVHIVNPIEGLNSYEGDLKSVTDTDIDLEIRIKTRKKIIEISKENIDKCRLAIKF